jgi:hypothetical protein
VGVHYGVAPARRARVLPAPTAAEQCAIVDAEKSPNVRHHQDGDYPDQGVHTFAGSPAIRK